MVERISLCSRCEEQSGLFSPLRSNHSNPSSSLGFFLLRPFNCSNGNTQQLICFRSDRLYTIGRKRRHCQIVFDHCSISRRHCQILLDGADRRLRLVNGFYFSRGSDLGEVRRRLRFCRHGLGLRVSLNGAFLNSRKLQPGAIVELSEGDEVTLGCGKLSLGAHCVMSYGFLVERIILSNFNQVLDVCKQPVVKANILQNLCKCVLSSGDPINYLRCLFDSSFGKISSVHPVRNFDSNSSCPVLGFESHTIKIDGDAQKPIERNYLAVDDVATSSGRAEPASVLTKNNIKADRLSHKEGGPRFDNLSDGQTFFLNRLKLMAHGDVSCQQTEVTLMELLHPVESLSQIFIATFTLDISWFLSYCQIPANLPVTVACHNTEKCWSLSSHNRTLSPYPDYPNLLLVYPSFPDEIAFGNNRNKKGVACHHPKLFLLQRDKSVRVVVTSANLVTRQWNQITNTVWWQDFPCRDAPDYSSLFASTGDLKSDFAAQLAGFIASLITDVPSQAHWIKELAKYNFGGAAVQLIASIPGMHAPHPNYSGVDNFQTVEQAVHREHAVSTVIGSVQAYVVGLSHRFHNATDSSGEQLKKLASFLRKHLESSTELVEVFLKRNHNIPADDNAISVHVFRPQEMFSGESIQLGFLPRDVAKWAAPLADHRFLEYSAFIYPREALTAALDGNNTKVQCFLSIAQGPMFSEMSRLIQPEHLPALSLLIASIPRCVGLWRLQEVLSQHKWPELLETDFVYASSSVGTSIDAQFLAAFSSAAGKRSFQLSESEESDPEWGYWSTGHEIRSPSCKILFPTIDRVKSTTHGIQLSKCLLSFSESAWQRLRGTGILHDACPSPAHRIGYPMHIKVARRRFQSKRGGPAFGWIYCGSHNFSPAAWGREVRVHPTSGEGHPVTRLRICNYELGVIFIVPPPGINKGTDGKKRDLDHISLPFVMPASGYCASDRPATARAMAESVAEQDGEEMDEDEVAEEEAIQPSDYVAEENEEDKIYAEMLWSQVDISGTQ